MKKSYDNLFIIGFASFLLLGCGGGGSSSSTSSSTSSTSSLVATDVYPTGISVSSPTTLTTSSSSIIAKLHVPLHQRMGDWWDHLFQSVYKRDMNQIAVALDPILPVSSAHAAPLKITEGLNVANYIQQVLLGSTIPSATTLPLGGFFKSYTAANCYGPQVKYLNHNNGTDASPAILPSGDTGMWLDRNGDQVSVTPCAAAQLSALLDPIKSRANASLILGARMVVLALSGSGLPPASSSSSLTSSFQTYIDSIVPSGTVANVTLAGITNNGSNSFTYQWRVSFTQGANVKWLVVNLTHTKTSTGFEGLLQYATSDLTSNTQTTANCGTTKKLATAGTLRYTKTSASVVNFSSREAPYCIVSASDIVTSFGTWVALDSNNELDPTKTTASDAKGWHQDGGGFKRFASSFNPTTGAGDYLFAWQAGIGDSNSRMFSVNSTYNITSEARAIKAFFGFAPNMATISNPGRMGELICNWAGPGSIQNPGHKLFQSQNLALSSTATDWNFPTSASIDSKIKYAPTNNCNSTGTMTYDVDSNGTLAAGEGSTITNSLDGLTGTNTSVFSEIISRGFTIPTMY